MLNLKETRQYILLWMSKIDLFVEMLVGKVRFFDICIMFQAPGKHKKHNENADKKRQ